MINNFMKNHSYKLFAKICESHLLEYSTAIPIVSNHPDGKSLIQYLHSEKKLAHNIRWETVPKLRWSELKLYYPGAWVIVQGSNGVGAIKAIDGRYEGIVVNPEDNEEDEPGEIIEIVDNRGGTVKNFLKSYIGKLEVFYIGSDSLELLKKSDERNKRQNSSKVYTSDTLAKKFKPLWKRAINAAIADIKGITVNMIKNGAFDKAINKLSRINKLERALENIEETGSQHVVVINKSVRLAVGMAASHHYPEETGELVRQHDNFYIPENYNGVELLLKDISNGDPKKLGTVLHFFKQGLMTI